MPGYGQIRGIMGKIVEAVQGNGISLASIHVFEGANEVYAISADSSGRFVIPAKYTNWSSIRVTSLNYEDLLISAGNYKVKNGLQDLGTLLMRSKAIRLNEVTVRRNRQYRDTTLIDLRNSKLESSVFVEDLLSRQMGFYKDAKGQLFYKGKAVSDIKVNGSDFFGKNNLDILSLLPALSLQSIRVVESNIDSLTQTTTLQPSIKIDLILKEQFKNGRFGTGSLGIGTSKRNVLQGILYNYRANEQLSVAINANNVNSPDNSTSGPRVSFSPVSNNLTIRSANLTYNNRFRNKWLFDAAAKVADNTNNYTSVIERQDRTTTSLANIFSSSNTRQFALNDTRLNITYNIDSVQSINVSQNSTYSHDRANDSSSYVVSLNDLTTQSILKKMRAANAFSSETALGYQKRFRGKPGRLLDINAGITAKDYAVKEENEVLLTGSGQNNYALQGKRDAAESSRTLTASFNEPMGNNGYINAYINYQANQLRYNTFVIADTSVIFQDWPTNITNTFVKPGFKVQRTFNRWSADANFTGIFNHRQIKAPTVQVRNFFYLNLDLKADIKLAAKKNLSTSATVATTLPGIQQLTNINNTFDLVFQVVGNPLLQPETRHTAKALYTNTPNDSLSTSLSAQYDYFVDKFGYVSNGGGAPGAQQNSFIANQGNAKAGQLTYAFSKTYSRTAINATTAANYQEIPTIVDGVYQANNGMILTQSFTASLNIFKKVLSINPSLALSYSRFYYPTGGLKIYTFTYSDRVAVQVKGFELNLYPLFNYNKSLQATSSFSLNGELKKNIFKKTGAIFLQAYDIFNSFNYYNNYAGPSFYQSVKYSTVRRYFLGGITIKLNNMK